MDAPVDGAGEASAAAPTAASDEIFIAPEPTTTVYSCRRCRQILFQHASILPHDSGKHAFSFRRQAKDRAQTAGGVLIAEAEEASGSCTSYFLEEALQWMKARLDIRADAQQL